MEVVNKMGLKLYGRAEEESNISERGEEGTEKSGREIGR